MAEWQRLATLRDLYEIGVPAQAIASKHPLEKRRALLRASSIVAGHLRKRYTPPLTLVATELDVSSVAGSVELAGSPTGSAADVKIQVVTGGAIAGGAVAVRVSLEDGLTTTTPAPAWSSWGAAQIVPASGELTIDGVLVTLSGTWAAPEDAADFVTYTVGPDPGIRWATASIAGFFLLYNRGADPKAQEPYLALFDRAKAFLLELAKGEAAELARDADATPGRMEGGPLFIEPTRGGFMRGQP